MKREDRIRNMKMKFYLCLLAVVVILIMVIIIFWIAPGREKENSMPADNEMSQVNTAELEDTEGFITEEEILNTEDPQSSLNEEIAENGTSVDITELLTANSVNETSDITYGIDVAKYQGTIDWSEVAASGVDFAMIRVGYRTQGTGEICEDANGRYNMQEAQANGIKLGVYFFSTAVTEEEAIEEADWVADYISQYQITYPVAYNCEGFAQETSRQYNLTQTERTDIAIAFLKKIYEHGYTPMFYAARNELQEETEWDTGRIESICKIWLAWYPTYLYAVENGPEYSSAYAMWQYTNQGTIPGISEKVDIDVAFFGYEGTAEAQNQEAPELVDADVEALMNFSETNETVTAKQSTNLRDIPSQGEDSNVMMTLQNGDTATRTGISDSGWSRVVYNGQTYYAVSSYLTTDLNAPAQSSAGTAESEDGLKTKFTECNDVVTAKIEVNLRTLPSVTNPDSAVVAVLHNGETATRTGINEEYGWSRIEYNGQTLYCVSSYLTTAY